MDEAAGVTPGHRQCPSHALSSQIEFNFLIFGIWSGCCKFQNRNFGNVFRLITKMHP